MQAQLNTQAAKGLPRLVEGLRAKLLRLLRTIHNKATLANCVELFAHVGGTGVGLLQAMKRSGALKPLLIGISMTALFGAAVYWAMPHSVQQVKVPALLTVKKGAFTTDAG